MEDEDSLIFQQIDIREKYAVGKHPEFMMYGVTQVRMFATGLGTQSFIHSAGRQQRAGAYYRVSPLLLCGRSARISRRRPSVFQNPSQCISRDLYHPWLFLTILL